MPLIIPPTFRRQPAARYYDVIISDTPITYWRLGEKATDTVAFDEIQTLNINTDYQGLLSREEPGLLVNDTDTSILTSLPNGDTGFIGQTAGDFPLGDWNQYPVYSIEVWLKLTGTGVDASIYIQTTNTNNTNVAFEILSTGAVKLYVYEKYNTVDPGIVSTVLNVGQTYHIVAVQDGTSRNFYINGVLDVTGGLPPITVSGMQNFAIGHNASGTNLGYFPGWLDELSIYRYALTPTQVLTHYNAGIGI